MRSFFRILGCFAIALTLGFNVPSQADAKGPKTKICGSDTIFNSGSAGATYTEKTKGNGEIMKTFSCSVRDLSQTASGQLPGGLMRCFYIDGNQDIFQLSEMNLALEDATDVTSALEGRVKLKKRQVPFSRAEGDRVIVADPSFNIVFDMNLTSQNGCGVQ